MAHVSSPEAGYRISAPEGQDILIPEVFDAASDPYLSLTSVDQQVQYYQDNGYVVLRNFFSPEQCDVVTQAFNSEVRPYNGTIYRQTSSLPEKHILTEGGYILNSIKHIQDMDRKKFPQFIDNSFNMLASDQVKMFVEKAIQDHPHIVQTMYFDGNPATNPHHDSYYLDSEDLGKMVAVWVALEDIHPGAGRFFIYPGSHKLELPTSTGDYDFAFHHGRYLDEILNTIRGNNLVCRAPALRKGDVMFWNSKTIHGSLETTEHQYSRSSLTAHYIPAHKDYVLFQKVKVALNLKDFNGIPVHCPKDQNILSNKLQMFALSHFPKQTNFVRQCIIKSLLR